jgi:hypothetical protein
MEPRHWIQTLRLSIFNAFKVASLQRRVKGSPSFLMNLETVVVIEMERPGDGLLLPLDP